MLNPLDPTSTNEYQNFNVPQDKDVVLNLYRDCQEKVKSLDNNRTDHKELIDWFNQKLVLRFRHAHDIENNDELREGLEEFTDTLHDALKKP